MAEKSMGTARLTELLGFLSNDLAKWLDQDRVDEHVATDLGYYIVQLTNATAECEEQIFDLAGFKTRSVLVPSRAFMISRELDAEAETAGRASDAESTDEEPETPEPTGTADANRDPHLVYRRKGQQRPDWSQ